MFDKIGFQIPGKLHKAVWIVCIGLILLNTGFFWWCLNGQEARIQAFEKTFQEKRQMLSSSEAGTEKPWHRISKDIETFSQALPPAMEFSERFQELKNILADHALSVDNLTFQSQDWEPLPLVRYSTSFTVSGSYAALKHFLADLQQSPSLFCIDKLAFFNRSTDTSELVDLNMSLSTYFRPN